MQDARRTWNKICTGYNIPGTWYSRVYVYKLLYPVLVLVQAALERTEGNTEGRMKDIFSFFFNNLPLIISCESE